jgi:hypothetical protein
MCRISLLIETSSVLNGGQSNAVNTERKPQRGLGQAGGKIEILIRLRQQYAALATHNSRRPSIYS